MHASVGQDGGHWRVCTRRIAQQFANCNTRFELHACAAHALPSVAVLAQRKRPGEVHATYSHIWRKQKLHTSCQSLPMEAYGVRGFRYGTVRTRCDPTGGRTDDEDMITVSGQCNSIPAGRCAQWNGHWSQQWSLHSVAGLNSSVNVVNVTVL